MSKTYKITLLPGDGVGPEVTAAARQVLELVGERFGHAFAFDTQLIGGCALDVTGDPLPEATLASCKQSDAILLGAVGGPKWENAPRRVESGLLRLRKELDVFANIRPAFMYPALIDHSPLKREYAEGVDLVIFRELTSGTYFGEKRRDATSASDVCAYTSAEIERIARAAFEAARARRRKVASVDKANVMETSRLWRDTVTRVHKDFPDVQLEHVLADAMSMQLIRQPRAYDVIVTDNLFGDILSDEASVIVGSIGLSPSASVGAGGPGLFEPVHGSAPDIAGKDAVNPIAAILSAAMLLRYGLKLDAEAIAVEDAVAATIAGGARTRDLGGVLSCTQMKAAVIEHFQRAGAHANGRVEMHWG